MRILLLSLLLLFNSFDAVSKVIIVPPSENAQEQLQEAMILAESGDEIHLTTGVYQIEDGLSLDIDNVIITGNGHQNSILDFSNQMTGAQGLMITSDGVTLKDFAIINTKGDAIKAKGSDGISFLNVRTEWTNGPKASNGAYGLYPVESKNVLIDGCIAIGASDAGIYVGQSKDIIVKNSVAEYNVAGIEIENSYYADVNNNIARYNTGGILVFDLPDLPQQGGHDVRVFDNLIIDNNTDNFAPEGNIVGEVPRGSGIIIMANSNVEIFNNDISNNGTLNMAIVSYSDPNQESDENYYPYPKSIQIHGNRFGQSGFDPDTEKELAGILYQLSEGAMPDIFWDGVLPISQMILGQPEDEKIRLNNNGDASFLAIRPLRYMLSLPNPIDRDQKQYNRKIEALMPVAINISE